MPRSFLVKQIKTNDFSMSAAASSNHLHPHWDGSYTFACSVTESTANLDVHLSQNGYIKNYTVPSVCQRKGRMGPPQLASVSPTPLYSHVSCGGSGGEELSDHDMEHPDSPQSAITESSLLSDGTEASSEGYATDAVFVSDSRLRRKRSACRVGEAAACRRCGGTGGAEPSGRARLRHVCPECGKSYATTSNLSRHKQTHRSLDGKMARKCPTCAKAYVSMPALAMHLLTHELKHTCGVCGKAFSRPWLLQGHLRSHTGEKPFACAHCGKAFADRSNLRAHMQTHSAFKEHRCQRCHKSFALKSYLNKHYESACLKGSGDEGDSGCEN